MINCDFHTHTGFSDDSDTPLEEAVEAAIEQGIEILAITDHYDPGYPSEEFPFILDFDRYLPALSAAKEKYEGRIEIAKGVEVGIKEGEFRAAGERVSGYDYDVVIGSFHCLGDDEIYMFDYDSVDRTKFLEEFYTYMYDCLREYTDFDILGHFTIIDRYIGGLFDYRPYEDVIDATLKILIEKGKSMEINTSSFAYGMETWLPRESVLRRYRELGGEMLTFGSDAHAPVNYRAHFDEAEEFARSLGFRYYCTYRERRPEFHRL